MMVKPPLVPLKPNHNSQILFWVLSFIVYFSLYFILYPSNISFSLNISFIRSPRLVLLSFINYGWIEDVSPIHLRHKERPR